MLTKSRNLRVSEPAQILKITTEAKPHFDALNDLFRCEEESQFAIGSEIDILTRKKKDGGIHCYRVKQLAGYFGRRPNRLSEICKTFKAFPPEKRPKPKTPADVIPYAQYENARRGAKRFNLPVEKCLEVITTGGYVEKLDEHFPKGFTDRIAATIALKEMAQKRDTTKSVKAAPLLVAKTGEIINRCHHDDCRKLIARLHDGTVKIAHFDPPYAQYRKSKTAGYTMADSIARTTCDNNSEQAAIDVTTGAIKAVAPKLVKHGVILLWQATAELRIPILQGIYDAGLEVLTCVVWDKQRAQMGRIDCPWQTRTEFLWVLCRANDRPIIHDDSGRDNIVRVKTVHQDHTEPDRYHVFQKPEELNELLIRKHSHKGELVVDAFGCSGSFCIAAERLGRHWIYCESNEVNYRWGAARVSQSAVKTKSA